MDQERIWAYFQNEKIEVFSGSIPRLKYLANRAKKLLSSPKAIALNIGVGNGWLEEHLTHEGWKIQSLDPNESAIRRLKTRGLKASTGFIEALPYKSNIFDVVFCSEVLEHLSRDQMESGLQEMFRVLKPDGYLLGTVPSQEKLSDNEIVCPRCGEIFHRWGHMQDFDKKRLREIFLKDSKILIIKPKLFISWQGLNLKRRIAVFIKVLLFYMGSHGSNETLYFQVKKWRISD